MKRGQKSHHSLLDEHAEATKQYLKFRGTSTILLTVILSAIVLLMRAEVKNLHLFAIILLTTLLFSRIRGFFFARAHDQEGALRILDGVKLERNNPHLEDFFHQCLKKYGLLGVILTLVRRAVPDILALLFFGIALSGLIHEIYPNFSFSLKPTYPILAILGYFIGDLYYKPLAPLMHAQREVFA